MQLVLKAFLSLVVIFSATAVARRVPSAAGLVGVMPLTGALVLAWTYSENHGNPRVMEGLAKGALWGIVPSILFFLVALFCFKRNLPLPVVLVSSFAAWAAAALVHQWILE